jgi:hypothetical protein
MLAPIQTQEQRLLDYVVGHAALISNFLTFLRFLAAVYGRAMDIVSSLYQSPYCHKHATQAAVVC